jgi:hypothetical protein
VTAKIDEHKKSEPKKDEQKSEPQKCDKKEEAKHPGPTIAKVNEHTKSEPKKDEHKNESKNNDHKNESKKSDGKKEEVKHPGPPVAKVNEHTNEQPKKDEHQNESRKGHDKKEDVKHPSPPVAKVDEHTKEQPKKDEHKMADPKSDDSTRTKTTHHANPSNNVNTTFVMEDSEDEADDNLPIANDLQSACTDELLKRLDTMHEKLTKSLVDLYGEQSLRRRKEECIAKLTQELARRSEDGDLKSCQIKKVSSEYVS